MPPYSGIRKVNGASGNNKCSAVCGRFLVQIEEIALHQARLSRQWDKILEHLLAKTRKNAGCKEVPSYAIINSQSVKAVATSEEGRNDEGKTKMRKRYIIVDVLGNLLPVVVHAANIHNTKSGIFATKVMQEHYSSIQKFCADADIEAFLHPIFATTGTVYPKLAASVKKSCYVG